MPGSRKHRLFLKKGGEKKANVKPFINGGRSKKKRGDVVIQRRVSVGFTKVKCQHYVLPGITTYHDSLTRTQSKLAKNSLKGGIRLRLALFE